MLGLSQYHIIVGGLFQLMANLQPIPVMNVCHKGVDWEQEYHTIAMEATSYALSHDPLFEGDLTQDGIIDEEDRLWGQIYTAVLFISISRHETGFINKIRGDYGNSVCLMQINKFNSFRIDSGWSADEIEADYAKCFELGYQTLQYSFSKSKGNLTSKLKVYVSGRPDRGTWAARERCKTFAESIEVPVAKWCGW